MLNFLKLFKGGFRMKSFLRGYGSILNIFPSEPAPKISVKFHFRTHNEKTDVEALRKDWEAIGKDIWSAIDEYNSSPGKCRVSK